MADHLFKHLVVVKFKEGIVVEEILSGMEKLVSDIDAVISFEWGIDIESLEMLRQGYTHAFVMTFKSKDDYNSYLAHPKHVEYSAIFSQVIDKIIMLDFPAVQSKSPP
ncbi:stress-response A/B barrel domain-containing protein At5g22580-like [Impatiens glandulifera]|uniref:stress-response A/B barrel domain-containing protein At5g22580-like n=1 Tax=Impatiens glandulifera TaxID=253017 RepID=UPI001FB12B54|nr:stress-response A/B barrel domain-containing protein At5g22580-like [Impatiens glandulifera]